MNLTNFQIIKVLDRGSYGEVVLAKSKANIEGVININELVAIKIVSKKQRRSISSEISVRKLNINN